ncbi:MAG: galactokinase [Lachnospiraceae bacterium]|nr:galactokinase [Lachnospiraceae bacterium]
MNITDQRLLQIYRDAAIARERYELLEKNYIKTFGEADLCFFTSPGRTEIVGNHTDHNGGRVIAGSISMDTIAAASQSGNSIVRIVSEGYEEKIEIDLDRLEFEKPGKGTRPLVVGILKGMEIQGYKLGGFDAYVSSNVIAAAGVSSSASFEMLICSVIDCFFNEGKMNYIEYAKAGQYSENHFWGKKSGLMDQLACAVGGVIKLDFNGEVSYKKVDFDLDNFDYSFILVNSRSSHADLSNEYSSVPEEMYKVAEALSGKRLCDVTLDELLKRLNEVNNKVGNDRAILRAIHFFEENDRVDRMETAMRDKNTVEMLKIIEESGNSSYKKLQNCIVTGNVEDQSVALNLGISEYLNHKLKGVCRVHGGGFAGVILEVVPNDNMNEYINRMSEYAGSDNVYPLNIRKTGAVKL